MPVEHLTTTPGRERQTSVVDGSSHSHAAILVVDDESQVHRMVTRALSRAGYRVLEAEDGFHAEAVWSQHAKQTRLLLTDMTMPGRSGWELAQALQARDRSLQVLFMTGYSEDLLNRQADLVEGVHFLCKPFAISALLDLVRQRLQPVVEPSVRWWQGSARRADSAPY